MIHALDPVFIVEKIAECPFYKVLPIEEALENTITQFKGLGGYEILGKCRRGGPVLPPNEKEEARTIELGNMTEEDMQRELAKPLFKDSQMEFESKIKKYLDTRAYLNK